MSFAATVALWGSTPSLVSGLSGLSAPVLEASAARLQPREPETSRPASGERDEGRSDEERAADLRALLGKIVNFAILAGTLAYFLRAPLKQYLVDRTAQVRQDLVSARETREAASRQIEEIDRRLAALPGELEALKSRGAEEIAAEEARIRQTAAADRERLLEQTRREIALQVKIAERALIEHAAELAVRVASERIQRNMTTEDQLRLVDRYVEQVKAGD